MKYILIALLLVSINAIGQEKRTDTVFYKEYGLFKPVKTGIYKVWIKVSDGSMEQTITTKEGRHLDVDSVKWVQFKGSPYRFHGYKSSSRVFIKY